MSLAANLTRIRNQIAQVAAEHNRPADAITLIAVGKQHSAEKIATASRLGQTHFGENYAQEGVAKIARVTQLLRDEAAGRAAPTWHFIGHIQSRKCRLVAENFHWVHCIDSTKIARKLDQHRENESPLNALIQVNLQNETGKHGIAAEAAGDLAEAVAAMPNLRLRGLMILPAAEADFDKQRAVFAELRRLREALNARGLGLDELSMGMSGDWRAALAEGATMLRIGTAIFGARAKNQ